MCLCVDTIICMYLCFSSHKCILNTIDQSKRLKQIRRVEPADGDEFSNPQTPVEWTGKREYQYSNALKKET